MYTLYGKLYRVILYNVIDVNKSLLNLVTNLLNLKPPRRNYD